ncbi:MAG: TatD family hydrolase [Syntrophomonadaceae bacterium]|nr:TatD family hydrolase [Syntrophomonadaceae bacterium]
MLIDTHAHLNDKDFKHDLPLVLERASQAGVTRIINVGYNLEASRQSVRLAETYPGMYAAVGFHPHDAKNFSSADLEELRKLAKATKVLAIGEMGLDYYRDLSPRPVQQETFRQQIALAKEMKLPVIVHDRDAHGDTVTVLRQEKAADVGGVLHCFSGSWEMARQCLNLGFYISLAGPVTYKNAHTPKEVARLVPSDRLLIETDAPYLTPEPYRGKRNEPAYVLEVAIEIAKIRKVSLEELAATTTANARRLFGF